MPSLRAARPRPGHECGSKRRKGSSYRHLAARTIRDARKTQELTLKQLARRTGLSVSLLSQIERAESSASISSLYKIASALQLRMGELFGDT